jgi:hypothetical protein
VLTKDTDSVIEARQIERWRTMTPEEKLHAMSAASADVRELAMAGLRFRHPSASEREIFLRSAILTIGGENAVKVYPEAAALVMLSPGSFAVAATRACAGVGR